jgi:hypothetical protein
MGRLFFGVVLALSGCQEEVVTDEFVPAGVYQGPVTLDDTTVIVTDVDGAVLAVIFTNCDGDTCAEVSLDGTIETTLGDIGEGTMPVQELELSGRRVYGELEYNDSPHTVKGTFSNDGLSLDAKISYIGHVLLDLAPGIAVDTAPIE